MKFELLGKDSQSKRAGTIKQIKVIEANIYASWYGLVRLKCSPTRVKNDINPDYF
jgi:hypothetical protein